MFDSRRSDHYNSYHNSFKYNNQSNCRKPAKDHSTSNGGRPICAHNLSDGRRPADVHNLSDGRRPADTDKLHVGRRPHVQNYLSDGNIPVDILRSNNNRSTAYHYQFTNQPKDTSRNRKMGRDNDQNTNHNRIRDGDDCHDAYTYPRGNLAHKRESPRTRARHRSYRHQSGSSGGDSSGNSKRGSNHYRYRMHDRHINRSHERDNSQDSVRHRDGNH